MATKCDDEHKVVNAETVENTSLRVDEISTGEKGPNSLNGKPEGHDPEYSSEEVNAVRKKIDWRIMPLAAWACGLQFVDKVCMLRFKVVNNHIADTLLLL
jgi:hypothetical protein